MLSFDRNISNCYKYKNVLCTYIKFRRTLAFDILICMCMMKKVIIRDKYYIIDIDMCETNFFHENVLLYI